MSTNVALFLVLIFSSLFCVLGNSWLTIWTMLELNTLSFCALLKTYSKGEAQKSSESAMKYLLIQIIASSILLMTASWGGLINQSALLIYFLTATAIVVKAAASPFHQWFINISKKMKWALSAVLFTWQKMAPLYLINFQLKSMLVGFILMSTISGSVPLMNKKNLKEIFAYSSVFNLSWMLMAILISTKLFFLFSAIYWASVLMALNILLKMKIENTEGAEGKAQGWAILVLMANLAGIPPLMGFMAKWMVFSFGLSVSVESLVTFMLVMSTIGFYAYLRNMGGSLIKATPSGQKMSNLKASLWFFMLANITAVLTISP